MTTTKKKKKYDWIKLMNEYQTTDISLRGLAEKYGVSFNTVKARNSKEGWAKDKTEIRNKITTEIQQDAINKEITRGKLANQRHDRLSEEVLDVVEELLAVYKETAQERKKRGNVNPFNLEKIMKTIEGAQKVQRIALNLDNQDESEEEPEMVFVENVNLDKI